MKKIRTGTAQYRRIKRWAKNVFGLSSSEANGLILLLPLLLFLTVSEPAWRWWKVKHWKADPRDVRQRDSLAAAWRLFVPRADGPVRAGDPNRISYFRFDPNTATAAELLKLGIGERLATRIENYRHKGGVFRKKEDLLRVYNMDSALYTRLAGYIDIAPHFKRTPGERTVWSGKNRVKHANDSSYTAPYAVSAKSAWKKGVPNLPFDLNLADTARLEAIHGIGEKLSRRIIKYRSSLGGFVRTEQLREVFGLDSTALTEIMRLGFVAPDFLPHRIDINTADEKLLDGHPYLNRQEARAIVAYRFQHGRFTSVSDLEKLPMFTEEEIRRLQPYFIAVE